ncbi:TPA: NADAR family protein [Streptococcus suis]|uniref:NADAR family protein n=1 Tax=Streptococcus suis TaxID=1307 RepID=UPI00041E3E5A|nr:NADAR family protein [Streptococcus suis]MCO8175211.1 NADAR family protein [Streptococcus suis]MCO8177960.1 NADAR family protein [Streptococcus suis]MCO8208990.1 NADAR family protein [Streptococcus suis]MCO8213956.1 NADAR family protein [Streptococcus suis]MCO8219137.1 NADAR family protein [Streptococcus suis]
MINFYKVNDPYGEFSNFSAFGFVDEEGVYWPTSEHYFQAQKFASEELREKIRNYSSPMDAALEGRKRENPLRDDWEKVKDDIMFFAVYQKFSQNPTLKELLLSTNEFEIIEHTRNDSYWADGGDGSGKNMLGQILMRVRQMLR